MTGESFEYAIKKDVRNNPIVREVDRERHREMWRSLGIGVFLVIVLVFSVWRHLELLRFGYDLSDIQAERAAAEKVAEQLRVDLEQLRSLARIEHEATGRLRMVMPGPEDEGVIVRVVASELPDGSVVAQR